MIRVDFSVPVEFEDIPIGIDFEAAWAEVNVRNAKASKTAAEDQQTLAAMAQTLHDVSRLLDSAGVVYAANCLHVFQGEPSLGSLAVAVMDFPYGADTLTAAQGTLRSILKSRGAGWSGSVIDAPCGQAAVFTGGQEYALPAALSTNGEEIRVLTAQFHAVIPIPADLGDAEQRMCLIAFSTPQVTHWEDCYAPIMAGVLRSLRFTSSAEPTADRTD